jgi:hypothetical protein
MDDAEFVMWYVNKHYIFTGTKFKYHFLINEPPITINELNDNISNSISIKHVGSETLYNFLIDWYNKERLKYKLDILDFLRFNYKVSLGLRSWIISDFKNKEVKKNDIFNFLSKNYDKDFIDEVINYWVDNEMIMITESTTIRFT